jgi:hypothetical protein
MTRIWPAMTTRNANAHPRHLRAAGAAVCLAALALTLLAAADAIAQQAADPVSVTPPPPKQSASPPPQPSAGYRPGLLDALGNWFDKSFGTVNSGIKDARETIVNIGGKAGQAAKGAASTATDVAKGTADTIVRLPGTRMVDGREKCAIAPNGAPDCYAAAEALCRSKGLSGGKSIETQSAQKCPTRVWLSGRTPQEGECATENFVVRAVCN